MPIKVTCPKCQGVLHAPDDAGGKRGKCPTCGTVLAIPAVGGGNPSAMSAPPPPPPAAPRPASLASMPDFDHNPRGTLPIGGETHRSSFADGPSAAAEPRRAQPPARLGAPPSFGPSADARKADPFAKPVKVTAKSKEQPSDGGERAYRRARRGLLWMQFAFLLFLIAPLAIIGLAVAERYGVAIPNQSPGYAKVDTLSQGTEIRAVAIVIPLFLGLFCLTLGRFGLSNAPSSSGAKTLALASACATLFVLLGLLAFAFMIGVQISDGFAPVGLMPHEELPGMIQRIGLAVAIVFFPLSEAWSAIALARLGAALKNSRLIGRGTRFLLLKGLVVVAGLVAGVFAIEENTASVTEQRVRAAGTEQQKLYAAPRPLSNTFYLRDIEETFNAKVQPQWDKLGENKVAARAGLAAFLALFIWFLYVRLVGGGRRAIREWLAEREPVI